jgi:hypothetical protein
MTGYWVVLGFWLLTAIIGYGFSGGEFELHVGSLGEGISLFIALAWLLFPIWGYVLFRRRAQAHKD